MDIVIHRELHAMFESKESRFRHFESKAREVGALQLTGLPTLLKSEEIELVAGKHFQSYLSRGWLKSRIVDAISVWSDTKKDTFR